MRYDVVIIGGGHNGLVAAFSLARGGLRTLVLERRGIVGGACVTEEFAPGFRASPGALSMLRDSIWHDMRLRERGLHVDEAGPSLNVYPDGRTPRPRRRSIAKGECDPALVPARCSGASPKRSARPAPARRAEASPSPRPSGGAASVTTPARQYLDEHFDSEMLKSALGWESISNTLAGPSTPGTAYTLRDATWDDIKDDVADRVLAHLGTFVWNLPASVLHPEVLTPLDLERRLSLTGGHHLHGDMSPDQLLFLRPVRGHAGYRTPVDRLYMCGAVTHPGGRVTGANGRNCAREVLRDARGRG